MKIRITIFISLGLIFSFTGFSDSELINETIKSESNFLKIVIDEDDKISKCPYLKGEFKSACPYLNKIPSDAEVKCPYIDKDSECPVTGKKSEEGICPYLKYKEKPAKNYPTI
ncbi:MAG TPA: hypothetical protein VI362_06155 [Ignavibacteriaceae bacterium]|nr:hypothetical protein [Ignavibacteriaceae bacterium]